jgi:protein-disulfide isomerase
MSHRVRADDANGSALARREFVGRVCAAGAGVALAGCLGERGDSRSGAAAEPGTATDPVGTTSRGTETPDGDPLDGHPGAADLADQPSLGPDPTEATGVIVVFEDPSCHRCRTFERQTVPKIRENLVDPGTATLVVRNYPIVFEWGEPACQALESTFARDAGAFWSLHEHYFAAQPEFDAENVLAKTRAFLAEETTVDAEAVVADAEKKVHDGAVQADVEAAEASGATATPTVLLFRDGVYRTKAAGSVGYGVVESALGV